MNDRCRGFENLLLADTTEDIGAANRESLRNHLAACQSCRDFSLALAEDDQVLSDFVCATDEVLAGLTKSIMHSVKEQKPTSSTKIRPVSNFFSSGRTRIGLAAVFFICLLLGIDILDREKTGGLVWADVLAQIVEAEDFICRRIEKRTGEPERVIVEYRSAEYGLRQEIYHGRRLQATQFVIPAQKILYALVHRDRTFMKMHLTDEQVAENRRQSNAKEIVKSFRKNEFRNLGRKRIDGRMAEGIEISDPREWSEIFESGTWRLWVDIETQWPVLIELDGSAAGGSVHKTYTLKDFQWNAEFSSRDFEVIIPPDYEIIANIEKLDTTEDGAIAGLRAFATLMDGRYPSVLSMATAIAEAEKHLEGRHDKYDKNAGHDVEAVFTVRNTCRFYGNLVAEDMDPAYFGDTVDAREFDRVLMRWRLVDGRYRVIFGDLRVNTLEAADLESLERRDR